MNLIYMCVFHQESYINLLKLLVTSISVKGNINKDTTEILIITSPTFEPLIQKEMESFDLPIQYFTIDLHTLFDAGCSRLNIFKYTNIHNYDTILYLDTDILINSDMNVLFNLELSSDKIYALEEGVISHDYWGAQFFDFSNYDRNTLAFSSGILLFRNSDSMKLLFNAIQLHIEDYIFNKNNTIPNCLDQPFIVYNAISQSKYDNQLLKNYVENSPSNVTSSKVVYHFPGEIGVYQSKYTRMRFFWGKIRFFWEIKSIQTVNIYEDLWTCTDEMRLDIANFFHDKTHFKIAEIGAHKGYTTKIISHIFSEVYAVDNSVEWTNFNKSYNKDRTNIVYVMLDIYTDSWNIIPDTIDVVFIDAGHGYEHCMSDIQNSLKQFTNLKYLIFDDYGVWDGVRKAVDEMIADGTLQFERFIGAQDVLGLHGVVHKNTNEGIICRVNYPRFNLVNKKYSWANNSITFLENGQMDAFGNGYYTKVDKHTIEAFFGGRMHSIVFNNDYTEFTSTRHGDSEIIKGGLITD